MTLELILRDYSLMRLYMDTGCQYEPHLRNLPVNYLPYTPRCVLPWFHAKGHNMSCQLQFSGLYEVSLAPLEDCVLLQSPLV